MSDEESAPANYRCDTCNRAFWSLYCVENHVLIHIRDQTHKCGICLKHFISSTSLDRHKKNRHENVDKNKQDMCKNKANREEKVHHKCRVCSKQFSSEIKLKRHYLEHDISRPFRCDTCGLEFSFSTNLIRHRMQHKPDTVKQAYQCGLCSKMLSTVYNLKCHLRIHTGERPYKCEICSKRFADRSDCKRHQLSHAVYRDLQNSNELPKKMKIPKCSFCEKCFTTQYNLRQHISKKHIGGNKSHVCNICGKSFSLPYELKRHSHVHTGEGLVSCHLCDASFSRRSSLNRHLIKHEGGSKVYECKICDKKFTRAFTLEGHMTTHDGTERFLCSKCGRKFAWKSELNLHLKRNTCNSDTTLHKCDFCHRRFNSRLGVRRHMKNHPEFSESSKVLNDQSVVKRRSLDHNRLTPYECQVCFKKFSARRHLSGHYRIHTGENFHSCTVCDRYYTRAIDLENHLRKESHCKKIKGSK